MVTKFKIKKGRWQIGNLYDALIADKFDMFINSHREIECLMLRSHKTQSLKRHNHVYNSLNK